MSTDDNTTAFEQWEVVELAASASRVATPAEDAETELARLRAAARAEGYAEGVAAGRVEGEQACGRMKQMVPTHTPPGRMVVMGPHPGSWIGWSLSSRPAAPTKSASPAK